MADALCGPSNALQSFQKHTTVDRTLQQDRLISRHTPSQGFRSSAGQNAGALDSEFDAFQAGRPAPPPSDFHHPVPHFTHPLPQQQFAQPSQAPNWATDFQRLNISGSSAQPQQHQTPQTANAALSWHQDFMRQQGPVAQAPVLQQNTFGGMSGFNMGGFGGNTFMQTPMYQHAPTSEVAQGKQRAQEAIPAFDEAAFEQAFLQAEAEAQQELQVEVEQNNAETAQANPQPLSYDRPGETDPLLLRIRETRPAVYSAIQVWSETGLGRTEEAVSYLDNMASLEQSGNLVEDANEAKWIVDSLQRIVNRDAPQEVKMRAENLIKAINERLMSQYPLGVQAPITKEGIWEELEAAGYMRTPVQERMEQEPEQQEKEQPQRNGDDEMAATAGKLLEKVADNTSEKFQNSQFLELMRKLRDREVRVEEDKIVEVTQQNSTQAQSQSQSQPQAQSQAQAIPPSSQVPGVDPNILNHAATDFEMPLYPDGLEQETI